MIPYEKRLEMVRELGQKTPGYPTRNPHNLGLWTGIFMQTKWQKDSGRDQLPIWHLVNEALSVSAYECYVQSAHHPHWASYFDSHARAQKLFASRNPINWIRGYYITHTETRPAMWRAHTTAIRSALLKNQAQFSFNTVPKKELVFWFNWIRIVLASESIAPPTHKLLLAPLLSACMPSQSPLGTEACVLKKEPALRQLFLAGITRDETGLLRFIASVEKGEGPRI